MVKPSDALASKINCWDVGGRRSHPFVYLFSLRCDATKGKRASSFWS